jgi:hypothetical protein
MTFWLNRLRVALILSPAFLLIHIWILASSNGYLVSQLGMPLTLAMVCVSSIIESYLIVLAVNTASNLLKGK